MYRWHGSRGFGFWNDDERTVAIGPAGDFKGLVQVRDIMPLRLIFQMFGQSSGIQFIML